MPSARAHSLHRESLVWDMVWPWEPTCGNDVADLGSFKTTGHKVISATVAGDNHNLSEAISRIAQFRTDVLGSNLLTLCNDVGEIDRSVAGGHLAVLMHLEGTRCLERSLEVAEVFSVLGIRHALLAFNNANSAGGGCMDPVDGGLTPYGRRLLTRFESLGVLVDLSHTGHRTAREAMERAQRPCTYSHSNVAALWKHPRNVSDDEIKACAATGGVIGVSGSSMYHGARNQMSMAVFNHIDYIVQLVGIDHVGLGIDTIRMTEPVEAYMRARPDEWPDTCTSDWPGLTTLQPEQAVELTEHMLDAGYDEGAVQKVLGENFRRLCAAVWPARSH